MDAAPLPIFMPFPLFETKQLNEAVRRSAAGSFISLPDGVTHYELSNETQEEIVVFVHGFSVPYFIFDPTFEYLTDSGFRVLRYDLFGRGFSDRPRVRYNMDLFVRQLADLLDALGVTRPVHLIGLSMGGPIIATFTAHYPQRIRSLTLIDPAGVQAVSLSPMLRAISWPGIAEAVFGLVGSEDLLKSAAKDFYDPEMVGMFIDKYKVQMQYRGFKRSILSTVRNHMLGSFIETYRQIGKMDVPILLTWGRNDMTVPLEHSNHLRAVLPNAEFHIIEDCGHIPHYEKPDEFNSILIRFLRK